MKTVLVSSIICTLCSIVPALLVCLFGVDEAPTTWDSMTLMFLGSVGSTLVWLSVTIWAIMRVRRKTGRSPKRRTCIVMMLFASGYIVALLFLLLA